jgi:iron complex transport system substrate-binding protein
VKLTYLSNVIATIITLGAFFLSSCGSGDKDAKDRTRELEPLSVVEMDGYSVSKDLFNREFAMVPKGKPIPEEVLKKYKPDVIVRTPVDKVIVASGTYDPGIIFALGKGDSIIGSTEPEEAWELPEMREIYEKGQVKFIGYYNAMDFESIITLKPELVLTSSMTSVGNVAYLGFPILGTYSNYRNDLQNQIEFLLFMGKLYDAEDIAKAKVDKIQKTLKEIEDRAKYHYKPKLTWGVYFNKRVFTLSSNFWLSEIMKICGADYVFADIDFDARDFSLEEFITRSRDADIFFANPLQESVSKTQEAMVKYHPDLGELKAFSEDGVVAVTEALLWQDSGNLDEIALDMAALIHPELYPNRKLKYIKILDDKSEIPF